VTVASRYATKSFGEEDQMIGVGHVRTRGGVFRYLGSRRMTIRGHGLR
jgi:hypothetical protein